MIHSGIWDGLLKIALRIGLVSGSCTATKALGCHAHLKEHRPFVYRAIVVLAVHFALSDPACRSGRGAEQDQRATLSLPYPAPPAHDSGDASPIEQKLAWQSGSRLT